MIRSVLERISRNLVFKRRLPSRYGGCSLFVTPDAGLRYWRPDLGKVDPSLLDICAEIVRSGSIVWDIGANVGLFAFCAAGLAGSTGKVYAIEPDIRLAELLRKSVHVNPDAAPVEVLPIAIAECVALQRFEIAKRARASNHLTGHGHSQSGGTRETQTVISATLDWLLSQIPPPDIVKIDAEGAEGRILSAAQELLNKHRPIVVCEVGHSGCAAATRLFKEAKYSIFDANLRKGSRIRLDAAPWATLAIPE